MELVPGRVTAEWSRRQSNCIPILYPKGALAHFSSWIQKKRTDVRNMVEIPSSLDPFLGQVD